MTQPIYTVDFTVRAEQQKMEIPIERRRHFDAALRELLADPTPAKARKLEDPGFWEVRLTQWITIEYTFRKSVMVVTVVDVRDDKETEPFYYEP